MSLYECGSHHWFISSSNIRIIEIKIIIISLQIRPCYFYKLLMSKISNMFLHIYIYIYISNMLRHTFWSTKHRPLSIVIYTWYHFISTTVYDCTISEFAFCLFRRKYLIRPVLWFMWDWHADIYKIFFFLIQSYKLLITNWISLSWAQSNILNHGVKKLRGFLVSKPSMVGHLIYQMPIDEDVFIVYTMTWLLLTFTRHCFDSDLIHFFSRL